jgi:phosphoglycerate dehydrogenase-like enzyme
MTCRIAVLDDYEAVARDMADWDRCGEVTIFYEPLGDQERTIAQLAGFDIVCLMRERTAFPRAVIEALPRLRLIVTAAPRNAAIDLRAAEERGILVCGTQALPHPTVELVFAHLLEFARKVGGTNARMKAGASWPATVGLDLSGKVLGIVGLGRLGQRVAGIADAFGMEVIAWSQNLTPEACVGTAARHASKSDLLRLSDFVSIHVKFSERTRGLIGAEEISQMKPGAFLVNTSRGQVVDEAALIRALNEGAIAGAALDVFDDEPLRQDHPYRRMERAQISPHRGYATERQLRLFYGQMVEDICAYLSDAPQRVVER